MSATPTQTQTQTQTQMQRLKPGHELVLDLHRKFQAGSGGLAVGVRADSAQFAKWLDDGDALQGESDRFHFPPTPAGATKRRPGSRCIYLCGNSLGLQPRTTESYVSDEIKKWQRMGVEGHFPDANPIHPWVTADEHAREAMAKIVGAKEVETCIMNSLTCNLHLLMCAFYKPTPSRYKIICESKAFPSDHFVLESQANLHGLGADAIVEVFPRDGEHTLRTEDIVSAIREHGDTIALVMFSGVHYYTGQLFDMEAITQAGHSIGAKVGFDLAHAVGNAPLQLHDWGCDFACWCTYKYLNSGPGNIGGAFVHERYANDSSLTRLAGWWGHRKVDRFEMSHKFIPTPGAQGFMLSNPPVLCVAALRASTEIFHRVGMSALREKSVKLTSYLEYLIDTLLAGSVSIITPTTSRDRGAQLSLVFSGDAEEIHRSISKEGVICDLRKPSVMRIAPTPLYNSFTDVLDFVNLLVDATAASE